MFFGNTNKLEKEIKEKDEQISTLQLSIKELNIELKETIKKRTREVNRLNKKLDTKTKKLETITGELEKTTNSDALTGAYNRRYFYDIAENVISLSKREKKHLSLAVINIDKINNSKSAEVLQALVSEITNNTRESDVLVMFGEKEFVILFPNTSLNQALIISEKLRDAIESCTLVSDVRFTISMGVSEFIQSKDNIDMTLKRANKALRETTTNSMNRVIAASA